MTNSYTCPFCGGAVQAGDAFCQTCGKNIKAHMQQVAQYQPQVQQAPRQQAPQQQAPQHQVPRQQQPQQQAPVQQVPRQQQTMPQTQFAREQQAAQMQAARNQQAAQQAMRRTQAAMASGMDKAATFSKDIKGRYDSYMGTDIDMSAIGRDFNPTTVQLKGVSVKRLETAFAFFGKQYYGAPGTNKKPEPAQSRAASEMDKAEEVVMVVPERDFGKREGGTSLTAVGGFVTSLSEYYVPYADYITKETMARAESKEKQNRLKTKVATGEMSQAEAVRRSE